MAASAAAADDRERLGSRFAGYALAAAAEGDEREKEKKKKRKRKKKGSK